MESVKTPDTEQKDVELKKLLSECQAIRNKLRLNLSEILKYVEIMDSEEIDIDSIGLENGIANGVSERSGLHDHRGGKKE